VDHSQSNLSDAPACSAGPVDPSFRALSGRLEFTVLRHKFNKDSLPSPHRFRDLGFFSG